jgi:lactate dehydrogenase-like 2-hydroxyacid dehydrogenase
VVAATVLQVGEVPPPLAAAVTAKYDALVLPIDAGREDFLAEHGASVRAIVDAGRAPIDAKLMEALPNLGAIIHWLDGYETIDVDAARRLGIGVSNTADALTDAVADAAVGLILMTVRSLGPRGALRARRPLVGRGAISVGAGRDWIVRRDPWPGPRRFSDSPPTRRIQLCRQLSQPPAAAQSGLPVRAVSSGPREIR